MPLEIDLSKVPAPILESLILEGLRTLHEPKKSLAPPKRWRNKWRANVRLDIDCYCHARHVVRPNETFFACCVWPSYDTAETVAKDRMAMELRQFGYPLAEWINAYPDQD